MTGNEQAAPLNAFRCAWFRGTPYDPGIFSVPVATVQPDKVLAWMKREYSPQRLTIVVVARAPEGAILDALDRALATVTEGPPPHPPAVRLSPAPLTTVELPSFGEPVLMAGVGADGVSQEDHLPLALAFSLAVRRATSLTVAGLSSKPELTGQLATSTTRVAFAGYALADTATVSGQEPGMAAVPPAERCPRGHSPQRAQHRRPRPTGSSPPAAAGASHRGTPYAHRGGAAGHG